MNNQIIPSVDREVFSKGKEVCRVSGDPCRVEYWVKFLVEKAEAKIDWFSPSLGKDQWAVILHLGDDQSLKRVENAIAQFPFSLFTTTGPLDHHNFILCKPSFMEEN